jgi:hypothetical protein
MNADSGMPKRRGPRAFNPYRGKLNFPAFETRSHCACSELFSIRITVGGCAEGDHSVGYTKWPNRVALPSEKHLQRQLYEAGIFGAFDSAEVASICAVAVRIGKLCVVEQVEKFRAEFDTSVFFYGSHFM